MDDEISGVEVIAEVSGDGDQGSDMALLVKLRGFQETNIPNH